MDKPEALRLADELDADRYWLAVQGMHQQSVAEAASALRRLHAENASLTAALASSCDEQRHQLWESGGIAGCERARVAERQRDALLEALRPFAAADLTSPTVRDTFGFDVLHARVAIAAVEGEEK